MAQQHKGAVILSLETPERFGMDMRNPWQAPGGDGDINPFHRLVQDIDR